MKKVLLMLAFILPMACSFVACSSDDEPEVTELTETNLAYLQGTWDVSESSENPFYGKLKILVSGNRIVLFQKKPSETNFEEVDSYTFEVDGKTLTVRTTVLWDENGQKITADLFDNATIDVKGLVDRYDGEYQIKVFSIDDITLH